MAAYGLYTHIQSNRWRSVALMIGLFLQIYLLVYAVLLPFQDHNSILGGAWSDFLVGFPYVTVTIILWIVIAYFFHQHIIDRLVHVRNVTRAEEPQLYSLLGNLCISRGMAMPKLKIIDDVALNAFATGLTERQYAITVTTGLKQALTAMEMEAVLGHELTHIRNGDVRLLVIATIIAGVFSFFVEMIFETLLQGAGVVADADDGGVVVGFFIGVFAFFLIALAWVLALFIRLWLSRHREFLADAGAVELTKNPDAIITALRKIENRGNLTRANSAVMEMCIDDPRRGFSDIFSSHPPVMDRVQALVKFAGGHDPGPLTTADLKKLAWLKGNVGRAAPKGLPFRIRRKAKRRSAKQRTV